MTFADNTSYIYEEMQRQHIEVDVVFLYNKRCQQVFEHVQATAIPFETKSVVHMMRAIYHLATSEHVIVDNYFGFLSAIKFKENVQCTQIWHAAGAVKRFGMMDPSNEQRSKWAIKRFKKVYAQFHRIVVGSDFFADIYKQAFLAKDEAFLRTGIPRTDFFFQEEKMKQVKRQLFEENPILRNKKVILYAPTFRNDELYDASIHLDIEMMYQQLRKEYVLLIRLHPSVAMSDIDFMERYRGFLFDYSQYANVNDLLAITDVLISDYSSIPMEFAFFNRKMIFYAYDYKYYDTSSGFWEDYPSSMPGPVVTKTAEIITEMKQELDEDRIKNFSEKWNEYSTGKSSEQFVQAVFGKYKG